MLQYMTLAVINDRSVVLLAPSARSVLLSVGRLLTLLVLVARVPASSAGIGSDGLKTASRSSLGLVLDRRRGARRRIVVVAALLLVHVALRGTRRRRVALLRLHRVTVRVVLRLALVVTLLLISLVIRVHLAAFSRR